MGKLLDKIRGLRKPARPFCTTVVVAAGQSRRMGKDKLLLPLGEGTVLEHTLRAVDASERTDEKGGPAGASGGALQRVRPAKAREGDPGRRDPDGVGDGGGLGG